MARSSLICGNWEEYARIVMGRVTADTLLDIDAQLERLNVSQMRVAAQFIAFGAPA